MVPLKPKISQKQLKIPQSNLLLSLKKHKPLKVYPQNANIIYRERNTVKGD
jgi:hypothetical protein